MQRINSLCPMGASIDGISWYGIYCNTDLQSNIETIDFIIGFYRDNKGLPGEEIFKKTIKARVFDTGQKIAEQGFYNGRKIYKFTAEQKFLSVKTDETIWISIAEVQHRDLRSTKNGWVWQWLWCFSSYKADDTKAFREEKSDWKVSPMFGQLAFSLNGNPEQK